MVDTKLIDDKSKQKNAINTCIEEKKGTKDQESDKSKNEKVVDMKGDVLCDSSIETDSWCWRIQTIVYSLIAVGSIIVFFRAYQWNDDQSKPALSVCIAYCFVSMGALTYLLRKESQFLSVIVIFSLVVGILMVYKMLTKPEEFPINLCRKGIETFSIGINYSIPRAAFYDDQMTKYFNGALTKMDPTLIEGYSGS